ncbi:unnamed protein product [Brassicogethes aeneus]|uniref:non-specific serine/threonine protein kinase n=1 Tax=Brassicogethes aeneus TaxID=1431903 RepID=A0A9P0FC29_BRAAE|nr:unnamed protein product [Brassicogethes aeneus]
MAKSSLSQSGATSESSEGENSDSDLEKSSKSLCVMKKQPRISTPISLLIESLVMNICTIYETDAQKAKEMYKLICSKLHKMRMIDESYNMNEFEGMRSQLQKGFIHLITANQNKKLTLMKPTWPKNDITDSHYLREFEEVEYIAGGGFGQVFLVRHKLDGTSYAMKKIPIRCEGIDAVRSYLSEVKTFASLNHSNIVQYKAAWLEIVQGCYNNNAIKTNRETQNSKTSHVDDEYVFSKDVTLSFSERQSQDTDFEIDFERSLSNIRNLTLTTKSRTNLTKDKSKSASDINALCKVNFNKIQELRIIKKPMKWATLYIQMALCQSTLKQWLEKRNEIERNSKGALVPINNQKVRFKTNMEILMQLLKGIEYIHSKGIVHHDIKPSNVFIQPDDGNNVLVQLGDFGLACPLQSARHTLAFGTKLYAAPEQLAGECVAKSDLYSLGIVLYELVETFHTDMERVGSVTELRRGALDEGLRLREPLLVGIVAELTAANWQARPAASDLLKRVEKTEESEQIENLKRILADKEREISQLKELLKTHGINGPH